MGKATCRGDGISIEVEIRSVNNRYLLVKSHIPESFMQYEQRFQRVIRKRVKRGTVDLFIRVKRDSKDSAYRVNKEVLAGYLNTLAEIRKKKKLPGEITPELLSGLPGVVEYVDVPEIKPKIIGLVEKTLEQAADRLVQMRTSEGGRMIRTIIRHRKLVEKGLRAVERKIGKSCKVRLERMKTRVAELLDKMPISADDPTLQRELAVLADRADITEEVDRLKSHIVQFDSIAAANSEIGRPLDFLLQEMVRETNTIGSKACDAAVSHDVVEIKAELEKIREQVQNIE
jgi:uncharacterized protein (TIGR00255 family)